MKEDTKNTERQEVAAAGGNEAGSSPYKTLTIDYALYESCLENSDLSESQKREFLDTLWNIIVGFVDLGFGVHPLQQAAPNGCGQDLKIGKLVALDCPDMVSSGNQHLKEIFSKIAQRPDCGHAKKPVERG